MPWLVVEMRELCQRTVPHPNGDDRGRSRSSKPKIHLDVLSSLSFSLPSRGLVATRLRIRWRTLHHRGGARAAAGLQALALTPTPAQPLLTTTLTSLPTSSGRC